MKDLFAQIDRVAKSAISVMILGETGAGKEIVAEQVHRRSGRTGPFVPLNCAALPENLLESELFGHEKGAFTGALKSQEGLFESADGGTLFLDEIGELPVSTQVKLLRVLQERKVMRVGGRTPKSIDVRFVSATNRDVEQDVEEGGFRQDLYFRLNGISLLIPPLRSRRADIVPLAEHFVAAACRAEGRGRTLRLSDEARQALEAYAWPGNVRELQSTAERAVLLCDGAELEPRHLARQGAREGGSADPGKSPVRQKRERLLEEIEALEKERVVEALARSGGNQTKAAELLGISRRTLVTRLGSYDLPRPRKKQ
jgi:DNA-binding NtrC family response regulator